VNPVGQQTKEQSMMKKLIVLIGLCGLLGCVSDPGVRIDQVPMYGGIDRSADPRLAAGDRQFIDQVVSQYGDHRAASKAFVNQGFAYYYEENLDFAMRRFNQAWLLDDEYPEVYYGFGTVLYLTEGACPAMDMLRRADELPWPAQSINLSEFWADLGFVTAECLASDPPHSPDQDRGDLWRQVDQWFEQAKQADFSQIYVHQKWWQALYLRGQYAAAWAKIDELRALGGSPEPRPLNGLMRRMPQPESSND